MTKTEATETLRRRGLTWSSDQWAIVDALAGYMFARGARTPEAWDLCWEAAEGLLERWGQ